MREGWNIIIRYDEEFAGFKLWLLKRNPDGSSDCIEPVNVAVTHRVEPYELPPEPTIVLSNMDGSTPTSDELSLVLSNCN